MKKEKFIYSNIKIKNKQKTNVFDDHVLPNQINITKAGQPKLPRYDGKLNASKSKEYFSIKINTNNNWRYIFL